MWCKNIIATLRAILNRVTIFQRIAIGNTLVMLLVAVAGTLITRYLVIRAVDWILILLVTLLGILLSIGLNFMIISAALRPLRDLGRLVKRLQNKPDEFPASPVRDLKNADPYTVRMATTLYSLFVHLEERNQELQALSERAINAQELERKVIAQSLHDDTGQALTMLAIHLDRINERIPDDEKALKKLVEDARALTASALAELRRILVGLRPAILDDLGLVPAIRWYARTNLEASGVHVIMDAPNTPLQLPPSIATILFRIAQEAINNIVRHAHASSATIVLNVTEDVVRLKVEDNGTGFNQERVSQDAVQSNHLGLVGIRERAQLVGGQVIIRSTPGKGSALLVTIPLHTAGAMDHG